MKKLSMLLTGIVVSLSLGYLLSACQTNRIDRKISSKKPLARDWLEGPFDREGQGTPLVYQVPDMPKKDIVDMHFHAACMNPDNGCIVSQVMRNKLFGMKFRAYTKAFGLTKEDVENKRDEVVFETAHRIVSESKYVSHAVILALDGVYTDQGELDLERTQVYVPDAFIHRQVSKYDNLWYGPSINPMRKTAIADLHQAKKDGARLIKWIPCTMLFDPSDSRYNEFYDTLVKLNLPLLSHVGEESSFAGSIDKYCDPLKLEPALERGVKVIAAHMGSRGEHDGEFAYDRLQRLWQRYPNLYSDNSATIQFNRPADFLLRAHLDDRILYGSDFPLVHIEVDLVVYTFKLQDAERFTPLISYSWQRFIQDELTNPLDRDVAVKKALGVPEESFYSFEKLLEL